MHQGSFLARFVVLAPLVTLAAGCGGGAATGNTDQLQIGLSQFEITLTNTSGRALVDLVAEIEPAGPASHFTTRIYRLENGEKRSVAHSAFFDRDSVPFSPRTAKASRVIVTGQDISGKQVRVEMPFR